MRATCNASPFTNLQCIALPCVLRHRSIDGFTENRTGLIQRAATRFNRVGIAQETRSCTVPVQYRIASVLLPYCEGFVQPRSFTV